MRDTVRTWVDEQLIPVIGDAYVEGKFPKQLIPGMAELGLFGANLPEEYGCAGLNNVAYGLIMQELERGDSGIRSFASVQGALVMYPIYAFGSDEQKKNWLPLPGIRPGDRLLRADRARLRLQSRRDDHHRARDEGRLGAERHQDVDHERLAGHRLHHLGQDRRVDDAKSIRGFIVPTDTKGYAARDQKGKLSLRGQRHERDPPCRTSIFRRTRSCRNRGGLKSPLMCLTQARYGIAWGAIGAAMACYDEALRYAQSRVMFDKPIAGTQIQQVRLVEMLTEITKAQFMTLQLGRLKDAGTMTPDQVSLCKRNNVDIACDIAREARRLLGANGILAEYHSMRHMANLESVYTYEGTHDMHSLIVGQAITGLAAF